MPSERKSVTSYLTDQSYRALKAYADSFDCSLSKALEYLIQSSLLGQGAVGQGKVPHSTVPEELDALISERISNRLQQLQQEIDEDQLQQKIQQLVDPNIYTTVKAVEERLASLERKTRHLKEEDFEWLKNYFEGMRQKQQKQKEKQSNENAPQQTKEAGNISKDGSADQVAVPVYSYDAALQVIKQLLTQGKPQKQIAEHLNQQGYPTKTGAGQWDQPRVSRAAYDL